MLIDQIKYKTNKVESELTNQFMVSAYLIAV